VLVDARAELGECPVWCERTGNLYWTNINGQTLHRWSSADASTFEWTMPERLGSFALCHETGRLLLGLASGIALFDTGTGRCGPLIPVEADQPATRINDGRCDPQGRFVFGMFNAAQQPISHFYRVSTDLSIERLPLPPAAVGNSIAFSPDGQTLYFADSPSRTIFSVDYRADGMIGKPRVFVQLSNEEGYPDGSVVDAQGGLWNAHWEGGCVVRYDPRGAQTHRIALPASLVTCPAFGGPSMNDMYLKEQPSAGAVFHVATQWRGLPAVRFGTPLS
jgi:L-arabinonolactonase